MSKVTDFFESVRDHTVSFAFAAVPTFLGTAALATMFSLGMGLGAAIGLPGALTVVTGLVMAGFTLGGCVIAGAVLGLGGAAGIAALADKVPFLKNSKTTTPGLTLGVVAGLAASAALAFSLAAGEPQQDSLTHETQSVTVTQEVQQDKDVLGPVFTDAGNGAVKGKMVLPDHVANDFAAPKLVA